MAKQQSFADKPKSKAKVVGVNVKLIKSDDISKVTDIK